MDVPPPLLFAVDSGRAGKLQLQVRAGTANGSAVSLNPHEDGPGHRITSRSSLKVSQRNSISFLLKLQSSLLPRLLAAASPEI